MLKYQHSSVIYTKAEQNSSISYEKTGSIHPKERFKNKAISKDSCNLCIFKLSNILIAQINEFNQHFEQDVNNELFMKLVHLKIN